jgi:hypothetical protein
MEEILNSQIFKGVVISLSTMSLVALFRYFRLKLLNTKYDYLIGEWNSYHFSRDESHIHEIKVLISLNLFGKLLITMEEKSVANYLEKGTIAIVENSVFGLLKGKAHPGRGFLILKLPFNRKGKLPAMNGLYTGLDQNNIPMSIKIHFSRNPLNKADLRKELGNNKKFIVSDKEATLNIKQSGIIDKITISKKYN